MVHALSEIRRVLLPIGILIDLRPYADHWPVEVVTLHTSREVGRVTDLPREISDDKASDEALEQAASRGWFTLEQREYFPFFYYWDTPNEMDEWIKTEWDEFIGLDENTVNAARSAWSTANADARVRVRMKMLIARWRKQ